MKFSTETVDALKAKLDGSVVKSREQAGRKLSYIEGWHAIAEANRIFGFDGWSRQTVETTCVWSGERKTRNGDKPAASYTARVRITVGDIIREGTGAGSGFGNDHGEAHESAVKEAETDAMKRALMTFGNPFGLALYDKDQTDVERSPSPPVTVRGPDSRAQETETPPALFGAEIAAKDMKDLIDKAPNLTGLNFLMSSNGQRTDNVEPTEGSRLWKIKRASESAYAFLVDRANKRRAMLANAPAKVA